MSERSGPWANLLSPEAVADPYRFLAALRAEHGPVVWSSRHKAWLLIDFAEVAAGYRDPRLSSDRVGTIERRLDDGERAVMGPTLELLKGWMVFRDDPDHLFAGHETTADLLANGTLALSRHPDQTDLLRRQPDLWPVAVEELLRYDGPTKVQTRVVTEAHGRSGRELRAGDVAFLCLSGANRDERAFPDPDRLDVARDPRHHVAFGLGAHHCLGAPLARLEGQLGLRTLFERCPHLEVTGDLSYEPRIASRSLTALPVAVS